MSVTFTTGRSCGSIEDDGVVMSGALHIENSFGQANYSFHTNGPHGGNQSHGGFAEIAIETSECLVTHLAVHVDDQPALIYEESGKPLKIVVRVRGDYEISALAAGLEFLATQLRGALKALAEDEELEEDEEPFPPRRLPPPERNADPQQRLVEFRDTWNTPAVRLNGKAG